MGRGGAAQVRIGGVVVAVVQWCSVVGWVVAADVGGEVVVRWWLPKNRGGSKQWVNFFVLVLA